MSRYECPENVKLAELSRDEKGVVHDAFPRTRTEVWLR